LLLHSTQIGLVLLHLAVDSLSPETRRNVNSALEASAARMPQLTSRVVRDALAIFLSHGKPSLSKGASVLAEEQDTSWNKHARLSAFLLSTVSFSADLDLAVREDILVDLVILAHHHLTRSLLAVTIFHWSLAYIFVHLHQVEHHDKHGLTCVKKRGQIHTISLTKIWTNSWRLFSLHPPQRPKSVICVLDYSQLLNVPLQFGFAEASYTAVTTLAFVSPATVLPRIVEQLRADINPSLVNALTESDFGIWATPEGSTFIDGKFNSGRCRNRNPY